GHPSKPQFGHPSRQVWTGLDIHDGRRDGCPLARSWTSTCEGQVAVQGLPIGQPMSLGVDVQTRWPKPADQRGGAGGSPNPLRGGSPNPRQGGWPKSVKSAASAGLGGGAREVLADEAQPIG